jgi:Uma2 family endonuclease
MYRLSVKQYHQMIEAGILKSGDPIELLEGWLIEQMTHHPPAAGTIGVINAALLKRLPDGWFLRIQSPITTKDSEPEPDLAIVTGSPRDYLKRHPERPDIALLIEVADTSLVEDRTDKARIYARAKIPTYWIVNIPDMQVEVYTDPRGGKNPGYRKHIEYKGDETILFSVGGQQLGPIPAKELLP